MFEITDEDAIFDWIQTRRSLFFVHVMGSLEYCNVFWARGLLDRKFKFLSGGDAQPAVAWLNAEALPNKMLHKNVAFFREIRKSNKNTEY